MRAHEISTFSDVLFYMEKHGIAKDDAATIAMQLFQWGMSACIDRMRPTRPTPEDAPEVGQLPLIEAAKPAKKATTPRQVARTFPDDFTLTPERVKFASDRGFALNEIHRMFDRFRDRNVARGEKYVNWDAAWRTWVNNQVEFKNRDQRNAAPQSGSFL